MKTNKNQNQTATVNQFEVLLAAQDNAATKQSSRKLAQTEQLQSIAQARATNLVTNLATPERSAQANAWLADQSAEGAMGLINLLYSAEDIHADAKFLEGTDEETLGKLLESQRSNRSKAKRAGLGGTGSMGNIVMYLRSLYAELMVRDAMGKAYKSAGGKLPTDHEVLRNDSAALQRRINSLASKKSRLKALAKYDEKAKEELEGVEAELEELRGMKPGRSTTTVKSVKLDDLKKALDAGSLDAGALQDLLDSLKAAQ